MKKSNAFERIKQLFVVKDKEFRKILLAINVGLVFVIIAFTVMFGESEPLRLEIREIFLVSMGAFVGLDAMFVWLSWQYNIQGLNN